MTYKLDYDNPKSFLPEVFPENDEDAGINKEDDFDESEFLDDDDEDIPLVNN